MINLRRFAISIIIVATTSISLVGCSDFSSSPVVETLLPTTLTSSPVVETLLPTTSTSLPTLSPSPTRTLTPTLTTPTRTPHPTQTRTPTPVPTRTADEQRALMVEMLKTNGDCEFPCWWGVVPGQSDWQTVMDYFWAHRVLVLDMPHPDRSFDYRITFDFSEKDKLVESIEVHSEIFRGAVSERFAQDWHRYSPNQILNRYGVPSQVYLQLVPLIEQDSPIYYQLWLVYDQVGFFIVYTGPATDETSMMRFCPQFEEVTQISLYLELPQLDQSVIESPGDMHILEEATGMDVATFYETFNDPASDVCLESPSDIWP